MLKWLHFNQSEPDQYSASPFDVFYGLEVPLDTQGQNGDVFFRYHNGNEFEYKKVNGEWQSIALTSTPYQNGRVDFVEEKFVSGSGGQSVFTTAQNFSDETIDLWENGQLMEEWSGSLLSAPINTFVRDGALNTISFSTPRPEGSNIRVRIYNATGFFNQVASYADALVAGEDLVAGDICRQSGGLMYKALADSASNARGKLYIAKENIVEGVVGAFWLEGSLIEQSGLVQDEFLYLSNSVAGAISSSAPSASGNVVLLIGKAQQANKYQFIPRWIATL